MSASANYATSETTNNTQDRRLTSNEGDIFGFNDGGGITLNEGSALHISRNDPDVAKAAFSAARDLAASSNSIAGQVAATPVDTASVLTGQKTTLWMAVALAIAIIFSLRK